MKFVDEVKILVGSGSGGNGAASFRREKFIPFGGPDGGDGGRGGNLYFRVKPSMNTLSHFRGRKKYIAKNGENGMHDNKRLNIANGRDTHLLLKEVVI